MKKRYFVFIITLLAVILSGILPAFLCRISTEGGHNGFVTALEFNRVQELFETGKEFEKILGEYKGSGITAAAISEENNTFDVKKLDTAKKAGLEIALTVYGGNEKPSDYEASIDKLVKEYGIEYIILRKTANDGDAEIPVWNVIKNNHLTLVVVENENQLSNEMPAGYEKIVESAEGRVMRAFETYSDPGKNLKAEEYKPSENDLLYYQMLNSARDRNTEFFIINQIENDSASSADNAAYTCRSVEKIVNWLENSGYTSMKKPDLSGYDVNTKAVCGSVAFVGIMMALAVISMLGIKTSAAFEWVVYIFGVLVYFASYFMPEILLNLYPTAFASVSACFCIQLAVYTVNKLKDSFGGFMLGVTVFAVSGAALGFSTAVLSAALSGADYYLNNKIFSGVSISLIFPVVYTALSIYFTEKPGIIKKIKKPEPVHYVIIVLMLGLAVVYLIRSGNSKISLAETVIRNTLAEFTKARPRTKEVLIGWPCLALFVYYSKNSSKLLKWIAGTGSAVLFASVINTFCHVFADVSVSCLRTVNGFVFSLPVIGGVILINIILKRKGVINGRAYKKN